LVVQALATVLAAVCVGVVWRRGVSLPIRAAVLLAATPVAVPIVMFYDLMLSGVAIAWLVRAARADGFLPWSKTLLAVAYVMPLVAGNLQGANHWFVAPIAAASVLGLAVAAAVRTRHSVQSDGVIIRGSRVAAACSTITSGAVLGTPGVQT
jgi:hypothetical protein